MDRQDFMDIVYSELESDPDNNRANRIIWAADGYAERRVDDALQVLQSAQLDTDCISRQVAIKTAHLPTIEDAGYEVIRLDDILSLPSTQHEPCEDAVSIEEIINALDEQLDYLSKLDVRDNPGVENKWYGINWSKNTIAELPPVTPKQRTGEYVHVSGYSDQYKCTACGIDIVPMRVVKFCPECGAKILKMISGERVIYPWEGDAE